MRNYLSIGLAVGLLALSAKGGQRTPEDFINGTEIQLTNNSTLTYTQQNVFFKYSDLSYRWALATSNQPVTYVAANNTYYYTNAIVINTNIVNPFAWIDVPVYGDANANHSEVSLSVTAALDGTAATNAFTLSFIRMPDGINPDTLNNNGVNIVTIRMAMTGNTNLTASTNLLQTFTQGGGKIRLASIVSANSTTNAMGWIKKISLNGFVP